VHELAQTCDSFACIGAGWSGDSETRVYNAISI